MIKERTQAGMERARKQGKQIGRPSNINEGLIQSIKYMRDKGLGIRRIASELSVGVGTVYKVLGADTVPPFQQPHSPNLLPQTSI